MAEFKGYKKGVNLGGWLSQCNHDKQHYDSFINENDIAQIAEWGLDHVRVPVDFELFYSDEEGWLEEGFLYIDTCIAWCKKYHLNMILDLHKTVGYTFDDSLYSKDFFHSEILQQKFLTLWEEMAQRYGKYSSFLAFELLNEVVDIEVSDIWNGIANQAILLIRQYAPTTYIIIGGARNNSVSTVKLLDKPYDDRIVYTFHFYEPLIFTHQSAYWIPSMSTEFSMSYPAKGKEFVMNTKRQLSEDNCEIYEEVSLMEEDVIGPAFYEKALSEVILLAKERKVALYCGEYGVIDQADSESTLNWYKDVQSVFEKYNISRAAWTYKGKDFGIIDLHNSDIQKQVISLL